jgi:hypothetical protein
MPLCCLGHRCALVGVLPVQLGMSSLGRHTRRLGASRRPDDGPPPRDDADLDERNRQEVENAARGYRCLYAASGIVVLSWVCFLSNLV